MPSEDSAWAIIGETVPGASHIRRGLPNQDALGWRPSSGMGVPVMLAVSDGHGSQSAFRSSSGSLIGVRVALELFERFALCEGETAADDPRMLEKARQLVHTIVAHWRKAVLADYAAAPFTDEEHDHVVESRHGVLGWDRILEAPVLAYGATLLGVLITERFIVYVQLGDGDILTVAKSGAVSRALPHDARLLANETFSLSSQDAAGLAQVRIVPLANEWPDLILVSTDGLANSFVCEEDFLTFGPECLKSIQTNGLESVANQLAEWLTSASSRGSGDDMTLAAIVPSKTDRETSLGPTVGSLAELVDAHARQLDAHAKRLDEQTRLLRFLNLALIAVTIMVSLTRVVA